MGKYALGDTVTIPNNGKWFLVDQVNHKGTLLCLWGSEEDDDRALIITNENLKVLCDGCWLSSISEECDAQEIQEFLDELATEGSL